MKSLNLFTNVSPSHLSSADPPFSRLGQSPSSPISSKLSIGPVTCPFQKTGKREKEKTTTRRNAETRTTTVRIARAFTCDFQTFIQCACVQSFSCPPVHSLFAAGTGISRSIDVRLGASWLRESGLGALWLSYCMIMK